MSKRSIELTRGDFYGYEGPKSYKPEIFELEMRDKTEAPCICDGYFITIKETTNPNFPFIPIRDCYVKDISSKDLSPLPSPLEKKISSRVMNPAIKG